MGKRTTIAAGMTAGLIWSFGVLYLGGFVVKIPVFALISTIFTAFLLPGLVCLLMVARLAQRRFFDDAAIDGQGLSGGAAIDQKVLNNTIEQLVLALCLWPAAAVILSDKGPGVIMVLGAGFAVARIAFWIGYHISPPLRGFGFGATFYPTVLVTIWTIFVGIPSWL